MPLRTPQAWFFSCDAVLTEQYQLIDRRKKKGAVTGDRVKNRNPVGDTAPFIFEREYPDKKLMEYKNHAKLRAFA